MRGRTRPPATALFTANEVSRLLTDMGVPEKRILAAKAEPPAIPPPRPSRAGMNKLETLYARELEARRIAGEIVSWKYEALSLRLAKKTWYRPDFLVELPNGVKEIHETKGRWEDDARVKFKVAAELFPGFVFRALQRRRQKHGGGWKIETFNER